MKKSFLALLLAAAVLLCACTNTSEATTAPDGGDITAVSDTTAEQTVQTTVTTAEQTTAETTTAMTTVTSLTPLPETTVSSLAPQPIVQTPVSVEQFKRILGQTPPQFYDGYGEISYEDFLREEFVDITPTDVPNKGNAQIFRHVPTGEVFLYANGIAGAIIFSLNDPICYNTYHVEPCDYDGDGWMDLLTFTRGGSGMIRTAIHLFSTATWESVHITSLLGWMDYFVGRNTVSAPQTYPVYAKDPEAPTVKYFQGYITQANGEIVFVKSMSDIKKDG